MRWGQATGAEEVRNRGQVAGGGGGGHQGTHKVSHTGTGAEAGRSSMSEEARKNQGAKGATAGGTSSKRAQI